ncbi:MAG: NAD+ synthase [Pseudomonas sp.]|jgi:NAD+ synthase (glutamine-hydrolysing)|nr:NAD+ synthase [Pseudomonas sp.]MDD2224131.1 NAD+ synthase [Pseudomonas sp.]MDY0415128.1 NAD+ synthase [Pseudomonas sp.]NLO54724.1 NAD+ synthase [Gammaproteobacteria bacterium]
MTTVLRAVLAQLNMRVGDIDGNLQRILDSSVHALHHQQADLIVFPELSLCGYNAQDLLLRDSMQIRIKRALERLCTALPHNLHVLVGYPWLEQGTRYNCCAHFYQGQIQDVYKKQFLPSDPTAFARRYFSPGSESLCIEIKQIKIAIGIGEDIWQSAFIEQACAAQAKMIVSLNASTFHLNKQAEREQMLSHHAEHAQMPILYTSQVGAQDDLIFDGGSCTVDEQGNLRQRAPAFTEQLCPVELQFSRSSSHVERATSEPLLSEEASVYQALMMSLRNYVEQNGFKGVLLGLSGGIDSALVLAIAADALGADKVQAVMMPYHYTAQISQDDAAAQAHNMAIDYKTIAIAPMVEAFSQSLAPVFADMPSTANDTTEENLQARCRGNILMALSNKNGYLVLTTSNKSETAVGYATLYGDMAGGFALLKDVPKCLVYRLARYRNSLSPVIPERVISRAPSAELAPDQKDADSLPPYDILDEVLRLYVEEEQSAHAIIAQGFAQEMVMRILRLVDISEYKRRQAALGPRISKRSFGSDRRYPVTNHWQRGD